MDDVEQVTNLIGEIYDAALDRSLWPSVMETTCGYIKGACSAIAALDPVANSGQFYFSWGIDPHQERLYLERYVRLNPATLLSAGFSKVGEVESTTTVIPYDEFLSSRFYREWCLPQGYCDSVWVILEKSRTAAAAVSIIRHKRDGMVDDAARQRMGLLAPHFRRAVNIGKIIDLHKIEAAAFADTLDGLAAAMFLVDAAGRIVYVNAAAHAMLNEAAVVRAVDGKFASHDARAGRALQDIFMNSESGDAAVGTTGIAVPLTARDGERFVAHVLPLTSGARRKAGAAYSAVAAVFVHKAALDLPHPLETIASLYKLTPAEMRVLMTIVEIGGVPQVAPILGISEATVKSHLQHIFGKTDTSRQADLVKLVAGYMSPLAG